MWFSRRLMDHHETMLRVLRAPEFRHYRIDSVIFPHLWLQILPDDTINRCGTVVSVPCLYDHLFRVLSTRDARLLGCRQRIQALRVDDSDTQPPFLSVRTILC